MRENIRRDLIEQGLNDSIAVQVTNSKDNPDIFGKPNVYRVIVGGTIEQSGIPTIGIAQDDIHNLMDAGGANFGSNLYGVGPDGIGGTADDEDIDFRTDTYDLFEGFTGQENTLNVSAWAFVRGGVVAQP